MKKIIQLYLFVLACSFISAQDFEVSTLRMGPYKISMEQADVEKTSGTKMKVIDGTAKNAIKYGGEILSIDFYSTYMIDTKKDIVSVLGISTTSKKFKTKSGIGVGSTRDDLINAFRNHSSFSVSPSWDEDGKRSPQDTGYFVLNDETAGTNLSFKFVNNVVTEISVSVSAGG